MSLIDDIYNIMLKEYEARQKEREKILGKKTLTATEIANFCEEKAILRLKGVKPKIEPEKIGARLHGTLLHENFERLLNLYFRGKYDMEKEVRIRLGNWKILGHPDIMLIGKENNDIYDFKFVNPYKFKKALETENPALTHVWQLNLYMYMLQLNKVPVSEGNLVYVSKSASSFYKGRGENKQVIRIEEFALKSISVPYNENIVKVLLKHARDIIEKFERGENGFGVEETVEKLKEYYRIVGLDPKEIDNENFPKWGCEYCDYKDLCPVHNKNLKHEKSMER